MTLPENGRKLGRRSQYHKRTARRVDYRMRTRKFDNIKITHSNFSNPQKLSKGATIYGAGKPYLKTRSLLSPKDKMGQVIATIRNDCPGVNLKLFESETTIIELYISPKVYKSAYLTICDFDLTLPESKVITALNTKPKTAANKYAIAVDNSKEVFIKFSNKKKAAI